MYGDRKGKNGLHSHARGWKDGRIEDAGRGWVTSMDANGWDEGDTAACANGSGEKDGRGWKTRRGIDEEERSHWKREDDR